MQSPHSERLQALQRLQRTRRFLKAEIEDAGLVGRGTGAIVGAEPEARGRYIADGGGGSGIYHEGCKKKEEKIKFRCVSTLDI